MTRISHPLRRIQPQPVFESYLTPRDILHSPTACEKKEKEASGYNFIFYFMKCFRYSNCLVRAGNQRQAGRRYLYRVTCIGEYSLRTRRHTGNHMQTKQGKIPVLEGKGLSKAYGGIKVVDQIDITVHCGQIRAVIGENGAGKSTLMKMLTGIEQPTGGDILVHGEQVTLEGPGRANDLGIGIVHQELQLVPMLSVADNLMLVGPGNAPKTFRGSGAEQEYVRKQLQRVGLDVSPMTMVSKLSAAEAQLLEVAKALALDAKVLIFDEPTSALPKADVNRLLDLVEDLRERGRAILYISHHLSEIMRLADDISILRDGRLVGDRPKEEVDTEELIRLMVDRPVSLFADELHSLGSKVMMSCKDVSTGEVSALSFTLRSGEILGFAGLIGSGMHDAAQALCGDQPLAHGQLELEGKPVRFRSPAEAARMGVVLVPEERKLQGILPEQKVLDNFHVGRLWKFARGGILNTREMSHTADQLVKQFRVRLRSTGQAINTLSGGNQQKVVVARCVQVQPKVLILSEPTRGVDVGAKADIHQMILELASQGTSIIIVSSEMEEVLTLSHTIAVFSEGRMAGTLTREEASPTAVMTLATPVKHQQLESEYAY